MTLRDWLLPGLLLLVFAPALAGMAQVWSSVDYYSHGFLVPLVSAAAASARPARPIPGTGPWGMPALAASLLVYALGLGSGSLALQGLALVGAVAGWVLLRFGVEGLRRWVFPVGYLVFMVPLPPPLITPLILALQLWVSSAALAVVRWFGAPVLRDGNVMVLPGGDSLFVAEACSGITSLVTLLPVAVALAYFANPGLRERLFVVGAALPAALVFNLLRVVLTVAAALRFGSGPVAETPLHDAAGLITFFLATLTLVGVSGLLRRQHSRPAG